MNKINPNKKILRTEDKRLLEGKGQYVDDIKLDNQLVGYMLRSPHANAKLKNIDVSEASKLKGILDIITFKDYIDAGLGPLPHNVASTPTFDPSKIYPAIHYPLARDIVRYVGDGIAFIVAETRTIAQDAADLIQIEFDILEPVVGLLKSTLDDSPLVRADCPNNIAYEFHQGNKDAVDKIFSESKHVVKHTIGINRLTASPIETRGVIADFNPESMMTTVYLPTQGAFGAKNILAKVFNQAPESFRVIAGDVGGSFGMKGAIYAETPLAVFASQKWARPVKWISDRSEAFMSDCHARDKAVTAELALDKDLNFLALRVHAVANTGAYYSTMSIFPIIMSTSGLAGAYKTPEIYYRATAVFTNSNPMAPYRGSGRPDAGYIIERIIDIAARELKEDPIKLRNQNLIPKEMMPFKPAIGPSYDSGDFIGNQLMALEKAEYSSIESRRVKAKSRGKLLGFGLGNNVESAAPPGQEWAKISILDDGSITLFVGSTDQGQGHATMYSQIICDRLKISPNDIKIIEGDTGTLASGSGTGGSKVSGLGGSAVFEGARLLLEKAREEAAKELECSSTDIEYQEGVFSIVGTDRFISLGEVSKAATKRDSEGLTILGTHKTNAPTFPSGCHTCELEIDPNTGSVEIIRYVAVTDVGNTINPVQVEGQVRGGIVQALGQVLHENISYDHKSGQLLSGSFLDYAVPKSSDICFIETYQNPTKTEVNPLGVKGAGEIGTGCAVATFVNAIVDALSSLGVTHIDTPATAQTIWKAINQSNENR